MCALSVSFSFNRQNNPYPIHPITFYNKTTNKPVVLKFMASDTGAGNTYVNIKYAIPLGIGNLKSGTPQIVSDAGGGQETWYSHKLTLRIGSLKPITTDVIFDDDTDDGTLGYDVISKFKTVYHNASVTYHELPVQSQQLAAYTYSYNSQPRWSKRI